MKMANANVEFVTFEAQDVIATSLYLTSAFLNASAGYAYVGGEKIASISGKTFEDGIYKVSPVYSISLDGNGRNVYDVTLTKTDFTKTTEVAECWDDAGNFAAGMFKLLDWLKINGTNEQ